MDEELGRDECIGLPGTGSALRSTHSIQIDSQRLTSFLTLREACKWDKGYIGTDRFRRLPFWAAALVHVINRPAWRNRPLWPYSTLVCCKSGMGEEHFFHAPILLEPKSVSEEVHLEVNVARLIRLAGFSSLTWRTSSPTCC